MRTKLALGILLIILGLLASASWAIAEENNVFDQTLAPYGHWMDVPRFGRVWSPDHAPAGWRPFTDGRWVNTDQGLTWASNEQWGITYHYGRWNYEPEFGWFWIPGTVWSPGWVDWREGDDFVGWRPMPFDWDDTVWMGPSFLGFDDDTFFWWSFVDRDDLFNRDLDHRIHRFDDNDRFLRHSRDITHFRRVDRDRVVNDTFDDAHLVRLFGHEVPRLRTGELSGEDHGRAAVIDSDRVMFFRPRVTLREDVIAGEARHEGGFINGVERNRSESVGGDDRGWRFQTDRVDRGGGIRSETRSGDDRGWRFQTDRVDRSREGIRSESRGGEDRGWRFQTDRVDRSHESVRSESRGGSGRSEGIRSGGSEGRSGGGFSRSEGRSESRGGGHGGGFFGGR